MEARGPASDYPEPAGRPDTTAFGPWCGNTAGTAKKALHRAGSPGAVQGLSGGLLLAGLAWLLGGGLRRDGRRRGGHGRLGGLRAVGRHGGGGGVLAAVLRGVGEAGRAVRGGVRVGPGAVALRRGGGLLGLGRLRGGSRFGRFRGRSGLVGSGRLGAGAGVVSVGSGAGVVSVGSGAGAVSVGSAVGVSVAVGSAETVAVGSEPSSVTVEAMAAPAPPVTTTAATTLALPAVPRALSQVKIPAKGCSFQSAYIEVGSRSRRASRAQRYRTESAVSGGMGFPADFLGKNTGRPGGSCRRRPARPPLVMPRRGRHLCGLETKPVPFPG